MLRNTTKEWSEAFEREKERIRLELQRMGDREASCLICRKEFFLAGMMTGCPDCKRQKQATRKGKTTLYEKSLLFSEIP